MNCKSGYPVQLPRYYNKPSFEYLIRFYLDTNICQKNGINCDCFSEWLNKVFLIWDNKLKILDKKPKGNIENIQVKTYSLLNTVDFLEKIETISHLTLFLGEVDKYYSDFVKNIGNYTIKDWISDNESKYFIYIDKNLMENYIKNSPYISC